MYIHVVDTSSNHGQHNILLDERFTASLVSYAYRKAVMKDDTFPMVWRGLEQLDKADPSQDLKARVIVDSGAFTAFTTGKAIDIREYADWALEVEKTWKPRLAALHFMNLDVIGDQDASWVNHKRLEALGMNPLPIVTFGADKRHLIKALDEYEYIALGGLVPYARQRKTLQKWLDYCFSIAMPYYRKSGVMPKIHLLGMTGGWLLERYPAYSCDSSGWTAVFRFPEQGAPGIEKLPRFRESEGAYAANMHSVRHNVQQLQKKAIDSTRLWASRGIQWSD